MNNNKLYNPIHKIMNQLLDEIQRAIKNTVLDNSVGVAFSGVGVGGVVLFLWIQSIITSVGWRVSCWAIAGLLVAIVVPLNLIFQRQRPEDLGLMPDGLEGTAKSDGTALEIDTIIDKEWVETEWTVRRALGTSRFWWLALTLGTGLFAWYTVQVHQSQYLGQLGFGKEQVALALGVVVMSGIVGQIFLGHLSDRIGRELVWTISLSGYVLCYLILLVMASQPSAFLMYAMAAAQGALGYGLASLYGSMPADLFQGPRFAAILGVASIAANLGAGVGPWVAGIIFDLSDSYDTAWWLAIVVSFTSIAAVWLAAPRKVRCVPGQVVRRAQ